MAWAMGDSVRAGAKSEVGDGEGEGLGEPFFRMLPVGRPGIGGDGDLGGLKTHQANSL